MQSWLIGEPKTSELPPAGTKSSEKNLVRSSAKPSITNIPCSDHFFLSSSKWGRSCCAIFSTSDWKAWRNFHQRDRSLSRQTTRASWTDRWSSPACRGRPCATASMLVPVKSLAANFRLIVIDPDANLVPAMRASAYGLRKGRVLVLFPEGERSIDGPPKIFKKGAAILAIHNQCPIVPVALEGFYEAWPRGQEFKGFSRLQVKFLDPVYPLPPQPNPEQQYAQLTTEIRERVVAGYEELRARR